MDVNDIFKSKWSIPVAVGVAAFGAGLGSGYILGRKKMLKEIQDQVLTYNFVNNLSVIEPSDGESVEVLQPDILDEDETSQGWIDDEDEPEIEEIDDESKVTVVRNVFTPVEGDQWVWEDELEIRKDGREFYAIHHEEFMNNETDYDQETLTFYTGDDIMAGQDDQPIYDYAGIMGEPKWGHGSGDVDVAYVRNDRIHMEWEILRFNGYYQVQVLGQEIEAQYEAQDLKHSHHTRFRPE